MIVIQVLGCSHHHAPVMVREQMAFTPDQVRQALTFFRLAWPQTEAVLLSTCNRVELYTASPDRTGEDGNDGNVSLPEGPDLAQRTLFLAICRHLATESISPHLKESAGPEAVRHLFAVASGLDSMVVGEPQITAQVKQAYTLAVEAGTAGTIMHALFQTSLRCGKRIAGETLLHQRRVSIPSVAVMDFASQIFERLSDKQILVLGAGEMGEETLRYLRESGAKSITVINRSRSRAEALARAWNGDTGDWEERSDAIARADLVVSTTGATEPIVTLADLKERLAKRANRPLLILDLAVPRDIDPAIGQLSQVFLMTIDDLRETCARNQRLRARELPKAQRIIDDEVALFLAGLHRRMAVPVIRQLREDWSRLRDEELERLFRKLPDPDEHTQEVIREAFDRLVNKLLHSPMESLRTESERGAATGLIHALTRLFRLGSPPGLPESLPVSQKTEKT
ncbi:MAG: glutamyl-tRNA reductase [Planctomycetia bacterium]|nr:glutamyl-tRNA reductase [Planctomycetia bacterium]